jgi:chemotaxis protein methyltransferase CheR
MMASLVSQADPELDRLEMDLLLEAIFRNYGFDFRQYARGSVRRRLSRRMALEGLHSISGLMERVLHDPACMERLLLDLSVNVTAMFRDPPFFQALRRRVIPVLRTYPFIRIWNAGCSTGEETYSLAILLEEEGLYERARIYATDINEAVLDRAQSGVISIEKMRGYTENYVLSGGTRSFSEYYVAKGNGAKIRRSLLQNVIFAQHNLVSDRSFNEFNVIMCRNVMIYFTKPLQDEAHDLFYSSLAMFGVLAVGQRESIDTIPQRKCYEELDRGAKLYRRVK